MEMKHVISFEKKRPGKHVRVRLLELCLCRPFPLGGRASAKADLLLHLLRSLPEQEVRRHGCSRDRDQYREVFSGPLDTGNQRGHCGSAPVRLRQQPGDHVRKQNQSQPAKDPFHLRVREEEQQSADQCSVDCRPDRSRNSGDHARDIGHAAQIRCQSNDVCDSHHTAKRKKYPSRKVLSHSPCQTSPPNHAETRTQKLDSRNQWECKQRGPESQIPELRARHRIRHDARWIVVGGAADDSGSGGEMRVFGQPQSNMSRVRSEHPFLAPERTE